MFYSIVIPFACFEDRPLAITPLFYNTVEFAKRAAGLDA
jgi:hypothetical protein